MKLRKLTLYNVRKFAKRTAVLGPFGDGLTTIMAENESGKSTFFGALHALFFYDYGSTKKELKEMQPYSGGAMQITAEIELDGVGYLIEKIFNVKKPGSSATVTAMASGTILKQAGDAEQWIKENILTVNNGPFGLLWVRQGAIGVDDSADGVDTRRDVMSSVRGQIDAVTGGRRMDSIVQRCKHELDTLITKQDKPKAGSQWKAAVDKVEVLTEEQQKLTEMVAKLSNDLNSKKRVTARMRALQEPEIRQERADAITKAAKHLTAAKEHNHKIKEAEKDILILRNTQEYLERSIKNITDKQNRRNTIALEIKENTTALSKAKDTKSKAQDAIKELQENIDKKEQERRSQVAALEKSRASDRAIEKQKKLFVLSDLRQQLIAPQEQLRDAEVILSGGEITQAAIGRLLDLERDRDIAIEIRKAHFSGFTIFADTHLASIDGAELPNGEKHLIDRSLTVALPGFGEAVLEPAENAGLGIADPEALQADITAGLRALGFDTAKAAQEAHAEQQAAMQNKKTAVTQIGIIAPNGAGVIEAEWNALCEELNHPKDKPATLDTDAAHEGASEVMEKAISNLDGDIAQLRKGQPALQDAFGNAAKTVTELEVTLRSLRADEADIAIPEDETATLGKLREQKSVKEAEVAEASSALEKMQVMGADLTAATAEHNRAVQADEEDEKEIRLRERELAQINGAIETQSEGAVEEKLSEVTGEIKRAEERAAQFSRHAKALRLLIDHLEAARAEAQETYFEPIRNELLPLLQQLHAGAEFQIDADKLLIENITRNGVTDKIEVLSGGAYEQITILTRLAFAKLFAKNGNHVPIILDDALVHTDDERISTMFNMLSQTSQEQQIIVLSCRTRAFSKLGGERAHITESDER